MAGARLTGGGSEWDDRFAGGHDPHGRAPSPPLPQAAEAIGPGLALDLACGAGRHALFLAERGWRVYALDASRAGISRLEDDARVRGVAQRIETRIADLESPAFQLEGEYDLVCDFYFLHRPLFAQVRRAVRPGGLFAAALHLRRNDSGRFLLEPGELRAFFAGWEILLEREGEAPESGHRHAVAEFLARKPAPPVRG
ncbi:MAG TPA: methyltransferase domain-containing protein [Myxococcales bacterium]|nr:methyltransferase domain-containing protein [Myxococcales bacterium]